MRRMLGRFMRVITRPRKFKTESRRCLCTAAPQSAESTEHLNSLASLTQDYKSLCDADRRSILTVYNQILPFIYKQEREVKYAADTGALKQIFDSYDNYWERIQLIDDIIDSSTSHLCYNEEKESQRAATKEHHYEDRQSQPSDSSSGTTSDHSEATPCINAIMIWLRNPTITKYHQHNAIHSMKFGHPLVIDCGFEGSGLMAGRASRSYVKQIHSLINLNMKSGQDPFNIHLCNVSEDSDLHTSTPLYPALSEMLVNHTDKCHTQVYDKSNLVMLSPDAPLYMEEYDPKKIYIIGGIVDLADLHTSTLDKAKRLGIESRKLPLDVYRYWGNSNNKRLTLVAVLEILQELRRSSDWEKALDKSLPQRFTNRNIIQSETVHNDKQNKKLRYKSNINQLERKLKSVSSRKGWQKQQRQKKHFH